jgi:hypothetical protein
MDSVYHSDYGYFYDTEFNTFIEPVYEDEMDYDIESNKIETFVIGKTLIKELTISKEDFELYEDDCTTIDNVIYEKKIEPNVFDMLSCLLFMYAIYICVKKTCFDNFIY